MKGSDIIAIKKDNKKVIIKGCDKTVDKAFGKRLSKPEVPSSPGPIHPDYISKAKKNK